MATLEDVMQGTRDVMTVRRVFGEPVQRHDLTVIPVAKVSGGGGGGSGEGPGENEGGTGAGFGVSAKPVGAYVIRGDKVRWQPAVDVARIAGVLLAGMIAVMIGLVVRSLRSS